MSVTIPARFCGPPESGNGGWTSGHLARQHPAAGTGTAVSVRLMSPPPLDRPMRTELHGDALTLLDGDVTIAQASPSAGTEPSGIRPAVSFDAALTAGERFAGQAVGRWCWAR